MLKPYKISNNERFIDKWECIVHPIDEHNFIILSPHHDNQMIPYFKYTTTRLLLDNIFTVLTHHRVVTLDYKDIEIIEEYKKKWRESNA